MTRVSIGLSIVMFLAASIAWSQDPAPAIAPQGVITPSNDSVPTAEPLPPGEQPQVMPQWTFERQMQNQQGTVTNTHRYLDAPEEGRYVREHVVTNPRGEMTQRWERVNTDPYNYTREHTITLPDGRTINHSHVRTWDGTDGTMERSFIGPNGQVRESVRSWTPDEPITGQMASMPEPVPPSTVTPASPQPMTVPTTSHPTEQLRWWQKLNPFGNRGNASAGSPAASGPGRGFTIGTPNSNSGRPSTVRAGEQPSVHGSQNTHRPSWAGGAPRSMSPQGPPAQANGQATAARPNPGRAPNR